MSDPKKISALAMIAAIVMVLGMISMMTALAMVGVGGRPAWVLNIFLIGGSICAFGGAIFYCNLMRTEEEGKLPTPPPAGQENNCEEDPEHC